MKNKVTKATMKELVKIAEDCIYALDGRGDLESHGCDDEDFFTTSVNGLAEALERAYMLGKADGKKSK